MAIMCLLPFVYFMFTGWIIALLFLLIPVVITLAKLPLIFVITKVELWLYPHYRTHLG